MAIIRPKVSESLEEIEDDLYKEIEINLCDDVTEITRRIIEVAAKVVVTDYTVTERICFVFQRHLRPNIGCQAVKSVEFKSFKNGGFGIFLVLIDNDEHESVWNAALFNPLVLCDVFSAFYTQHDEEKERLKGFMKGLVKPFSLS